MLCTAATRLTGAPLARARKTVRRAARTAAVAPRAVATGADKAKEVAADAVSDAGAALQAKAQQLADYAVAKWEASDNKPAFVATGAAGILGLYITAGVLNTVDHLPLINKLFELLGLGVSAWFAYRWFFVAGDKEAIQREVSKITDKLGL